MNQPRALSLFAGAGGGALALRRAGFDVLCIERDGDACSTLRANGFEVLQADVRDVSGTSDLGSFDLVLGGPPCQPFSTAGLGLGDTDPRDMIPEYVRIVTELLPRAFVMENVRGLTFRRHQGYLAAVLEAFPDAYTVDHRVLNAADFGVPQTRQRLFVVGRLDAAPAWPVPSHAKDPAPWQRSWVPMYDALGIREHLELHTNRDQRADGSRQVVTVDRPAPTITVEAVAGSQWKWDNQRFLTTAEAAAVQGFPPRHRFCGGRRSVLTQIGNACPPALLQAVITAQTPFVEVSPEEYEDALSRAADVDKSGRTVASQLGDYDLSTLLHRRRFLSPDGRTGFLLDEAGDFQGLFNIGPSGRGAAAVAHALAEGAATLDCFEPFLPGWYDAQGWALDHWEDNWEPGGPRVAYMTAPVHATIPETEEVLAT